MRKFLNLASKNAEFITEKLIQKDGSILHSHKDEKSTINGFLEDYATVIEGFLGMYEITFNEAWLEDSKKLMDYVLENFIDGKTGLFFFTSIKDPVILRRTLEVADNVIPSSNSIMALNLLKLSKYYPSLGYGKYLEKMVQSMQKSIQEHPRNHANWLHILLLLQKPFYEVAILGKENRKTASKLLSEYLPNTVIAATEKESNLSLLENRYTHGKTQIYICEEGACQLPLEKIQEALVQLRRY